MNRLELLELIRKAIQEGKAPPPDVIGYDAFPSQLPAIRPADVRVCSQCGAVVTPDGAATHTAWHTDLAAVASRWQAVESPREAVDLPPPLTDLPPPSAWEQIKPPPEETDP